MSIQRVEYQEKQNSGKNRKVHQPAPGIFFKDVHLENNPGDNHADQPEDVTAEYYREQACKCLRNPGLDAKLTGIRTNL